VFVCWLLVERRIKPALWYLLPLPCLALWLVVLRHATGHWLGNPEFATYNLTGTLNPVRFLLALLRRVYYLLVSTGHVIGTATCVYAFARMPILRDRPWRVTGSLVAAQLVTVSLLGGAVLERYLLPVLPIVYIASAIAMGACSRRIRPAILIAMLVAVAAANFINPPYPFPLENNLEFISFVDLQQSAAIAAELSGGTVATAFPMSNALRRPEYGFVSRRIRVREMPDFHRNDVLALQNDPAGAVIVFNPTYDPLRLVHFAWIRALLTKFYGYRPRMTADEIAAALSMHVSQRWTNRGLSMQFLER
jgi:hypothetical protein